MHARWVMSCEVMFKILMNGLHIREMQIDIIFLTNVAISSS